LLTNEGWVLVAVSAIGIVIVQSLFGIWFAIPLWILMLVFAFVFRDPTREVPSSPLAVVSPADGQVLSIEPCQDPFIDREAIRISIQMSFLGIYTTRSPIEGKVVKRWYPRERDNVESSSFGLWIQTDEEDDVTLVITRTSFINSPRCFVQSGERVGQGQRCGFIRFGTIIDLYVPANSRIDVAQGQKVKAGSDVVATLVHTE
jgi:phosphatidylserine decarboxylase